MVRVRAHFIFGFLAAIALFCSALAAQAHRLNESYVYFQVSDEALNGRIEVNVTDLAQAFDFASESSSKEEIESNSEEIFTYFSERLSISSNGETYPIAFEEFGFLDTDIATFALINFSVPGLNPTPDNVDLTYNFLFSDIDPSHLGYALIESNTRTGVKNNESHISLIFDASSEPQSLNLVGEPAGKVFVEFIKHGIWHIWLGFDHVLFLITLLLTSVMALSNRKWVPEENLKDALWTVLKIVTVFTVAHTITLSLAAFGVVRLNIVLVEAVIALSIAAVAFGNLFPRFHTRSLWIVLMFGLFHGFGFANVLAPLGIDPSRKVVGLAAFNIGVEIGQIAIVLVVFPILFAIRKWSLYSFFALKLGSIGLIAIALFWFIERTYDVLGPVRQTIWSMLG